MWAEALSVEDEGGHLQEGAAALEAGGRPQTERVQFLYMRLKITAKVS